MSGVARCSYTMHCDRCEDRWPADVELLCLGDGCPCASRHRPSGTVVLDLGAGR